MIVRAAITIGSTVFCGTAPCPACYRNHRCGHRRAEEACVVPDCSRRQRIVVVQSQDEVGLREAREQPVLEHGGRAADRFFGRLSHQHQRALPELTMARHPGGGARPRGHVQIVSARVHHRNELTRGVLGGHPAGKWRTCLLCYRQRIELGSKHRGRTRSVS
jgi:hypothetical protein